MLDKKRNLKNQVSRKNVKSDGLIFEDYSRVSERGIGIFETRSATHDSYIEYRKSVKKRGNK